MIVSQASETVMLFADRLFLSRVGKLELAAAMTGGLTSFMVSSFFTGVVGYVNALVAQYHGAKRGPMCARSTTQALYIAVASYPFLLMVIPLGGPFFAAVGQTPRQVALADAYLSVLLSGSIMLVARFAFASFFIGIGRTRIVMIASLVGMAVNIPANYVFIFGKLGFRAMGIRGAAVGTLFGSFAALAIVLVSYVRTIREPAFRAPGVWRFDRALFRRLLRFGVPVGAEMFLNIFAFNLFVQLMHSYGPDVAAAVTITFNYDLLAFIPMLGLGVATTAVVGNHIGAGDPDGAVATTKLSFRLACIYAAAMMALFIGAAPSLVALFSSGFGETAGPAARLAVILLRLASLYTLADATQIVFAGALRGAGDTKWVMRFSIAVHWTMAAAAVVLIRVVAADPVAVWIMFIGMILILGIAMYLRFRAGVWRTIRLIE